jgi:hypothetical protein
MEAWLFKAVNSFPDASRRTLSIKRGTQRRLSAIDFADMVSYSRVMGRNAMGAQSERDILTMINYLKCAVDQSTVG